MLWEDLDTGTLYKRNLTNAAWIPIGGASRETFNVVDYGAVGDGATNDTTAIQATDTAAAAAPNGRVVFPPGTYKYTAITRSSGVSVTGVDLEVFETVRGPLLSPVTANGSEIREGIFDVVTGPIRLTKAGSEPYILLRWAGATGTIAAPSSPTGSAELLGRIYGQGFNGTAWKNSSAIVWESAGTWSATANGGILAFQTTPLAETELVTCARMFHDGALEIGPRPQGPDLASLRRGYALTVIGVNDRGGVLYAEHTTDATVKSTRVGCLHYTNAELPVAVWALTSSLGGSTLAIGGGTVWHNATNAIDFYTAAADLTPTGTKRWTINANGHFLAGVDNTYDIGSSGALRPRNVYAGTAVWAPKFGTDTAADVVFHRNGVLQLTLGSLLATFAGDVTISRSGAADAAFTVNRAAGQFGNIWFQTGGSFRWRVSVNGTAEGGANAGSDFEIVARADDGTAIDAPLTIARVAGGAITITRPLVGTASTTAAASVRLPHGTAPTAPGNGDMWTTTAGLYVRINGATVGPLS